LRRKVANIQDPYPEAVSPRYDRALMTCLILGNDNIHCADIKRCQYEKAVTAKTIREWAAICSRFETWLRSPEGSNFTNQANALIKQWGEERRRRSEITARVNAQEVIRQSSKDSLPAPCNVLGNEHIRCVEAISCRAGKTLNGALCSNYQIWNITPEGLDVQRKGAQIADEYRRQREAEAALEWQKRQQEERAKREQESVKLAAEEAKQIAEVSALRDPNDVVARVLNFSDFGEDEGYPGKFWYKETPNTCRYKRVDVTTKNIPAENDRVKKLERLTQAMTSSLIGRSSIDLDELDPKNIKFRFDDTQILWGNSGATLIEHVNQVLFARLGKADVVRLKRGWGLIYSKYCKGKQMPF
jgi:hypothetical protein